MIDVVNGAVSDVELDLWFSRLGRVRPELEDSVDVAGMLAAKVLQPPTRPRNDERPREAGVR